MAMTVCHQIHFTGSVIATRKLSATINLIFSLQLPLRGTLWLISYICYYCFALILLPCPIAWSAACVSETGLCSILTIQYMDQFISCLLLSVIKDTF